MDNKNNNQTTLPDNNQDILNQYASSIKTDTPETNSPLNLPKSEEKESLKDFNSTPIDTPTPTPLSDNLEPSKSLAEDTTPVAEDKTESISELDSKIEPTNLIIPEPEDELKPESETVNNPPIEPETEIELKSVPDAEPKLNDESESEDKFMSDPEIKTEPEAELKPVSDIKPESNININNEPAIQTETSLSSPPSEDPEMIKQKIAEVLSYKTENNTQNPQSDQPKVSRLVKFLFTFSLITLLAVAAGLVYFITNSDSKINSDTKTNSNPTPTSSQSGITCELNGFIYSEGQSFPSADGCNTCTCKPTGEIGCTEKDCDSATSATNSADKLTNISTYSSLPTDWKSYTDSTYKFSINYSPEWVLKTYPEYKNIITFQSPEGKKTEELRKGSTPGDSPHACGDYQITCYKSFAEMVSEAERLETKVSSLSDWLKTSVYKDYSQNTINDFTSYSVTQYGHDVTKDFYIQNKDLSFCQITFCDRNLTPTEKQFVNSFKFN